MRCSGVILNRRAHSHVCVCVCCCRGAFSYVKRVTQKKGKIDSAAKFISARGGRRKAAALREMDLLSELDHERVLYFHDAFEKKNVVVLITELYPSTGSERGSCSQTFRTISILFTHSIQVHRSCT